jgi:hypothetical protein
VAEAKASRALAGRKLEAPSDAGHGLREGETVRGTALSIKSKRTVPAGGFRLARLRDDGRRPRAHARASLTGGVKQRPYGSQVNCSGDRFGDRTRVAHRTAKRPARACLRVTTRSSEVDAVR